jgi:hypothetical protein
MKGWDIGYLFNLIIIRDSLLTNNLYARRSDLVNFDEVRVFWVKWGKKEFVEVLGRGHVAILRTLFLFTRRLHFQGVAGGRR